MDSLFHAKLPRPPLGDCVVRAEREGNPINSSICSALLCSALLAVSGGGKGQRPQVCAFRWPGCAEPRLNFYSSVNCRCPALPCPALPCHVSGVFISFRGSRNQSAPWAHIYHALKLDTVPSSSSVRPRPTRPPALHLLTTLSPWSRISCFHFRCGYAGGCALLFFWRV